MEPQSSDLQSIMLGVALVLVATIVTYGIVSLVAIGRRKLVRRVLRNIVSGLQRKGIREIARSARFIPRAIVRVVVLVEWVVILFTVYTYITFSLNRFVATQGLGHQMRDVVFRIVADMADDAIASIPNIISIALIFIVARFTSRWVSSLLTGVEKNQFTLPGVDRETVLPTRRILVTVIWVFAFALAYPFIPGSSSQAFQGVSVLVGLMVSFGASSSIGQAMSGLVILYSRSMRIGDYVTIGDVTGSVMRLGFFAVRIRTAYQQEITIPNNLLVTSTIVNHTRLTTHGTSYTATVTIGYDVPWRQVQAMLLEAVQRISLIEQNDPEPYVTQHALSDFFVEYRLTCVIMNAEERRNAYNQLHAAIQDVFNENNVQIMSPHYEGDPSAPKVVPVHQWSSPLVKTQSTPSR